MAYSDYGSFVYLNGERRADKEDVGVYDTDEAPRYGATMSRDGETWECEYDYSFGAGFDDDY